MEGKRLSTDFLRVEWARTAFIVGVHGPFIWGSRCAAVQRFIDLPHAGDNGYL